MAKKEETAKAEEKETKAKATAAKSTTKKAATKKAEDKKEEVKEEKKASKPAAKKETKAKAEKKEDAKAETKKEEKKEVKEEKVEAQAEKKEEPKAKKEEKKEVPAPVIEEQDDDFDFDAEGGFEDEYSEEDRKAMEKLYEDTLTEITEKELISGTVVGITDREVIVNIGFKSDGLVSLSEFRDMPDLKAGDEVQVYIEEQENANGQLVLSRRKAKIVKAWESIQGALDNDEVIEGFVKRRTKGGLIVDVYGVEAFLPGSQIDVKPIRDFDVFVGKSMEVKVVKINYTNDNVVVSHKVLIEKDLEEQKAEILNNLEKGQVLEGVIKNMTNFGVFIDLGGVDGLLHITDISWGRINHPEEVLNLDEKVNVVVLDFDDNKQRISLGMKQLTDHPWDSLDKDIDVGSKVKGKIVNVADYGAFLEIIPGVEGLIHVSEMSWSQHLRNPSDFINVGDEIEAVVLTIDREERKMSVGIKQLTEDPWTKQDVLTNYAVGTEHKGTVRNLTNFGLFIELEEGIDGLVHVSDLSWTKKIKHPSEFVKVGEELEVKVMELDVENRRLALSHKHLEENPWDTFETVFTKGSTHKCTITNIGDKFATIELPYGLEGQVIPKNLKKEDGTNASEGETLEFKVLEFSKDDKRIVLSHTSVWDKDAEQPKAASSTAKKSGGGKKGNTLDKINKEVEKSTLGDLDALSALKDKMEDAGKATPKKTTKAKAKKEEEK
ncbi:small subunit ribosomal protein S1 [Ekhidna lutea]|uniref:Small ribosomal subunit protein bS1 n=1 Tax=Ekhidna lutea TaxID=447679 RepID=A0A239LAD1_EKHLU|nr:30S ribosomal protein S1 [Ekhidna lutea]SNT26813.1 small subunit ribosomal protein S1 [Ekhidna lutea]